MYFSVTNIPLLRIPTLNTPLCLTETLLIQHSPHGGFYSQYLLGCPAFSQNLPPKGHLHYFTIETKILESGQNFQLLPEQTKTVKYQIWQVLYHKGIGHHKTNIAMPWYVLLPLP